MTEYRYRWVRVRRPGTRNPRPDQKNVEQAIADGWEPVSAGDWPEGMPLALVEGRTDHALYRLSAERAEQRAAYYREKTAAMLPTAVASFLRDNDAPHMQKFVETDDGDRPNYRMPLAEEFYSPKNLAQHPDRAAELKMYQEYVAQHPERAKDLEEYKKSAAKHSRVDRKWLGLPPK